MPQTIYIPSDSFKGSFFQTRVRLRVGILAVVSDMTPPDQTRFVSCAKMFSLGFNPQKPGHVSRIVYQTNILCILASHAPPIFSHVPLIMRSILQTVHKFVMFFSAHCLGHC